MQLFVCNSGMNILLHSTSVMRFTRGSYIGAGGKIQERVFARMCESHGVSDLMVSGYGHESAGLENFSRPFEDGGIGCVVSCRVVSSWHAAPVGGMIGHRCRCFDFTSALRRLFAQADEVRPTLAGMRLWTKCDSMWREKRREVVDLIMPDDDGVTTRWRRTVDVGNLCLSAAEVRFCVRPA